MKQMLKCKNRYFNSAWQGMDSSQEKMIQKKGNRSMIKLPKEVNHIMKVLESKQFKVYAVGGCVRDSLMGLSPSDWDLATNARLEDLKKAFPNGQVISEKYSVIRMDYTDGEEDQDGIIIDIATFCKGGGYLDGKRQDEVVFADTIEEDLKDRDFTINAIADNPSGSIVDPYDGRADLKARLIRTIGDPSTRFAENPIRMLRGVRIAAEYNFDLHKATYEAMAQLGPTLSKSAPDQIRDEFCSLISGAYAGKGLRMLEAGNLMEAIVGKEAMSLNRSQIGEFHTLCDNIHKTMAVTERRLGLFYLCFGKKKGLKAILRLPYNNKTLQHLTDALTLLDDIYFVRTFATFKKFLAKNGMERYEYLHNLSKAQRITYDLTDARIIARNEVLKELLYSGNPIYIEDLAINGEDLIQAGIVKGPKVDEMLLMLTDVVHRRPRDNTKQVLLTYAKKFSKKQMGS
jgi:tRNA nucleotidyltransferase (CCA-adding enzyme)